MTLITNVNPNYVRDYRSSSPFQARKETKNPIDPNIVARVQPRASKGHHGPVIATLFRLLNRRESQLEPMPSRRSHRYLIGDNLAR